jgi:hypothetical protein
MQFDDPRRGAGQLTAHSHPPPSQFLEWCADRSTLDTRHSTLDGPATPLSIFLETTESTYELSILAIYRKSTISVLLY